MNERLLKAKNHAERGALSVRVSVGHRVPVHELAVTSIVVYPTARPSERKVLDLSTQNQYNTERS